MTGWSEALCDVLALATGAATTARLPAAAIISGNRCMHFSRQFVASGMKFGLARAVPNQVRTSKRLAET
jgi:hypothetical protein